MNPFSACIKQQQPIRLVSDEEQEHATPRNCGLAWPFTTCVGRRRGGRIRLPDDTDATDDSRILDDYLDPNTTVGIEPLLAQHAMPENDDDDDDDSNENKEFIRNMLDEPHRFLSRNPFATAASSSSSPFASHDFYDEDAQFLSDRRISDVLQQKEEHGHQKDSSDGIDGRNQDQQLPEKEIQEEFGQELVSVVRVANSNALGDWTEMEQQQADQEGKEMPGSTDSIASDVEPTEEAPASPHDSPCLPTPQPQQATMPAEEQASRTTDFPILGLPRTHVVVPTATANKPAAEETTLPVLPPPSPPTPLPESDLQGSASASGGAVLPSPPLDIEHHPLDMQLTEPPPPSAAIQEHPATRAAEGHDALASSAAPTNRRASVAASMAQSILGDKLEDFTEKLAFIKKNIIMSLEDDDGWDEDDRMLKPSYSETTTKRRTSVDPLVNRELSTPPTTQQRQHKRSSSLMDVASPAIARFIHQMSGDDNHTDRAASFSPSSFFASLATPESPPDSNAPVESRHNSRHRPTPHVASPSIMPLAEEDEVSDVDEEELFDFGKMLKMGKSVFNDVANRVRSANQQQQQQQTDSDNNDSWVDREPWI